MTRDELIRDVEAEMAMAAMHVTDIWLNRHLSYSIKITNMLEQLEAKRRLFKKPDNFALYLSIGEAMKGERAFIDLRYLGQSVAHIILKNDRITLQANPSPKNDKCAPRTNYRDFGSLEGAEILKEYWEDDWTGKRAASFRSYFDQLPMRDPHSKGNEEHRIEYQLIGLFDGKEKPFPNIAPVKVCNCRFAMSVGIKASEHGDPQEGKGAFDILARTKNGSRSYLTAIEVKDEVMNEARAKDALCQAAAYAVFLQRLLRSGDAGAEHWWKLFGMNGSIPDKLVIRIACAMPYWSDVPKAIKWEKRINAEAQRAAMEFSALCGKGVTISFPSPNCHDDCVELHAIFFNDCGTALTDFTNTF